MRVLVACEFSGTVRDAFRHRGHEAYSCDLLPCESVGGKRFHLNCDVLTVIQDEWDLMIAHPPCTHLCVSGAAHFYRKATQQANSLEFVRRLLAAPIARIALENPVGVISTKIRKPDQIVQPYYFGHKERKTTCLWLKNLPPLAPTKLVEDLGNRLHRLGPSPDRWKERSRTYPGIAEAMAEQWGSL